MGILQYLIINDTAQCPVSIKWGNGFRDVVMFQGKKYQCKGTGLLNKNLLNKISALYISMNENSQIQTTKKTQQITLMLN